VAFHEVRSRTAILREALVSLSDSQARTHPESDPADATRCQSLLLAGAAILGADLREWLFLLVTVLENTALVCRCKRHALPLRHTPKNYCLRRSTLVLEFRGLQCNAPGHLAPVPTGGEVPREPRTALEMMAGRPGHPAAPTGQVR
jgi:hypothetical protein